MPETLTCICGNQTNWDITNIITCRRCGIKIPIAIELDIVSMNKHIRNSPMEVDPQYSSSNIEPCKK